MKTKFMAATGISLLISILLTTTAQATRYSLTLGVQGDGIVTPDNTNSPYPAGVNINLAATASNGWYFDHWSGNASGNVNPLQVTMNSDLSITGNFLAYPVYTVTLATNGQGTIGLNPPGGSYYSNTPVAVTATPAAGWVFAGWSGAASGTNNPLSLVADNNSSLTGTFAQLPFFTVQPASLTNNVGSTVSFTAQAAGTGPLSYQWFFSGGTLGNASGTALTLTNVTPGQAGNYWVVATNNYGSATSQVATLTVLQNGPTNLVKSLDQGSLLAAIAQGGWVGMGFSGTLAITNTITITNDVVLDGTGLTTTLSGGNAVQLFYVTQGASLTITNLVLANGLAATTPGGGGAVCNAGGNVYLVGCTLTNNVAQSPSTNGTGRGGAVSNNGGAASLYQCVIAGNSAIGTGAGGPPQGLGGAIYNTNGSVTLVGCQVSANTASTASLDESEGQAMGGAIFQASGTMAVSQSSFISNQANGASGYAVEPSGPAYGGAIALTAGTLSIDHSQFMANKAVGGSATYGGGSGAWGGAVYNAASVTVAESAFGGNQVTGGSGDGAGPAAGGGIYNDQGGVLALNRSSFYSNIAEGGEVWEETSGPTGLGAGVFNGGQLAATNCTLALNSAQGGEDSAVLSQTVSGAALGGGLYNSSVGIFTGMNLTVASNTCISQPYVGYEYGSASGLTAGCQIANANANGTCLLLNSILAYGGTNSNAYGPITDLGYNICSDSSANLNSGSSFNHTDPLLAPLGNYGGPTWCMALRANSPAIDDADPNDFPVTDQRGYLRPAGEGPDIGAYEYGAAVAAPSLAMVSGAEGMGVSFTALPTFTYRVQSSTDLKTWTDVSTIGPVAAETSTNQMVTPVKNGQCFFRVVMQ